VAGRRLCQEDVKFLSLSCLITSGQTTYSYDILVDNWGTMTTISPLEEILPCAFDGF